MNYDGTNEVLYMLSGFYPDRDSDLLKHNILFANGYR